MRNPIFTLVAAALVFAGSTANAETAYEDKDCLACHSAAIPSQKLARTVQPVLPGQFILTPHNKLKCIACHSTARLAEKPKAHMLSISPVDCGQCHFKGNKKGAPDIDIANEYARGIHGTQHSLNNKDVPYCKDCHGFHEILPPQNPRSTINRLNIHATCGRCHGDKSLMRKYNLRTDIVINYDKSVHGKGMLEKGLNVTAVCTDCHGAHEIRPPGDPFSRMNRNNIPQTCGRCHEGIYYKYVNSIHGSQWAKGNKDVPVCTDCHGEHNINAPDTAVSQVNPSNIGNTCSKCHSKKPLANKYNMPVDRLTSFKSSYHGTALQLNSMTVANCASCHGSHDILPSSDPRSSINPDNLPRTCGHCHPQALKNKNIGKVHVSPSPTESRLLFIVRTAYMFIIGGSVAGFLFFIATDLFGAWRRRRKGHK